jgi:integration host factor subunit alpha
MARQESGVEMKSGKTMTKADIIETVYEKIGFSKKESAEIVELVFNTMKVTLEKGEKIKISGFGNFVIRNKKPRIGRNPQTGEEIEISARKVLTFKPSQVLKNSLNRHLPQNPMEGGEMAASGGD